MPTLLLFLGLAAAQAIDPAWVQPPPSLTLAEAIRLGLEHNPSLAVTRAQGAAADAGAREAEAARWPSLFAEAGWRRSDHPVLVFGDKLTAGDFTSSDFALDSLNHPDFLSHSTAALGVQAPLYTSGRIRAGVETARHQAGAAGERLRAAEADLVTQVTEAYFGLALARSAVEVAESALESARSHEASARARTEAGSALRSDLLRAEVRRSERERDLERRRADVSLSWARLRLLIGGASGGGARSGGEETGGSVAPAPPLATPLEAPAEDPGALDAWLARGIENRPEVAAAARDRSAAAAAERLARAGLGPEVAAQARYERNGEDFTDTEDAYLFGVSVRWEAVDRGRGARIAAARARSQAAEAALRAVEDGVRLEVESAWLDATVADRSLLAAREGARAAEGARRITAERYAAGLLPLTDLLDVETALLSARLSELSALFDAVVGRARLARAAGSVEVLP
jgi:outer membrane protein TolC